MTPWHGNHGRLSFLGPSHGLPKWRVCCSPCSCVFLPLRQISQSHWNVAQTLLPGLKCPTAPCNPMHLCCLCADAVCGPSALLNHLGILHLRVATWNVLCPRSTSVTPLHPWKSLALRWSHLCQVLIKRIMKLNNSCYYANLIARTTTKDSSRTTSALHKNTSWGHLHRNCQFVLGLARALHSLVSQE